MYISKPLNYLGSPDHRNARNYNSSLIRPNFSSPSQEILSRPHYPVQPSDTKSFIVPNNDYPSQIRKVQNYRSFLIPSNDENIENGNNMNSSNNINSNNAYNNYLNVKKMDYNARRNDRGLLTLDLDENQDEGFKKPYKINSTSNMNRKSNLFSENTEQRHERYDQYKNFKYDSSNKENYLKLKLNSKIIEKSPEPRNFISPHHLNSPTNNNSKTVLPNHEPTKCSFKKNGIIKAYAANTNQGAVRNYNEDRVSIILNIMKPENRKNENWPKCSFFGVYDGHGGVACADFLRDNLHHFVIKEEKFPWSPIEAINNGFEKAEAKFIEDCLKNTKDGKIERSGSCCIVVLIISDMCYVANVGDSRAIMSTEFSKKSFSLSRDHKPCDDLERQRIIEAGGKIYQSQATLNRVSSPKGAQKDVSVVGPHRVLPGRLSVSRTFGDIEAKMASMGGNPNVVICKPEIKSFRIQEDHDFVILGSDGIYDKLSTEEVISEVWKSLQDTKAINIHQQCGISVENVLKLAIDRKSLDNITVVMICFSQFKEKFEITQNSQTNLKNIKVMKEEKRDKRDYEGKMIRESLTNITNRGVITKNVESMRGHRSSMDAKKPSSLFMQELDIYKGKFIK